MTAFRSYKESDPRAQKNLFRHTEYHPTQCGLEKYATHCVLLGFGEVLCVYCGCRARPIQDMNEFDRYGNFLVTGYLCTCEAACDEVEINAELSALTEKFQMERRDIEKRLHKPNLAKISEIRHQLFMRSLSFRTVSDIGTEVKPK